MQSMQSALHEVMAGATRSSELEGFALLREEPWQSGNNFLPGVRGFADGMASGTDWRGLREQLMGLIAARSQGKSDDAAEIERVAKQEQAFVDRMLAIRWAGDDIDAAVDWYANQVMPPEQSAASMPRSVDILVQLSKDQRHRVLDWFEGQRADTQWDDAMVVAYGKRLAGQAPDADIERLAAMPDDEASRAAIVAGFVQPYKKSGQLVLRHEPGQLLSLMKAANLSAETEARLKKLMSSTGWSEDDSGGLSGH